MLEIVVHLNWWACDGLSFDGDKCSAQRKRGQAAVVLRGCFSYLGLHIRCKGIAKPKTG